MEDRKRTREADGEQELEERRPKSPKHEPHSEGEESNSYGNASWFILPEEIAEAILLFATGQPEDLSYSRVTFIVCQFVCRQWRALLPRRISGLFRYFIADAAKMGSLSLVQWAKRNGCNWSRGRDACANAARGGFLEILKWMQEHGCSWDRFTCSQAALGGHLEVLKWARAQDRKSVV